jgi:hypothetical protein
MGMTGAVAYISESLGAGAVVCYCSVSRRATTPETPGLAGCCRPGVLMLPHKLDPHLAAS